jgi:sec-independent protein translocase protein TatA
MDIGVPELLIILVIVVLIFGSGKLVKLGKELGQGIREFREGLKGSETTPDEAQTIMDEEQDGYTKTKS